MLGKGIGMSIVDEARTLAADLIEGEGSVDELSEQEEENQETDSEEEYRTKDRKDYGNNKVTLDNDLKKYDKVLSKL